MTYIFSLPDTRALVCPRARQANFFFRKKKNYYETSSSIFRRIQGKKATNKDKTSENIFFSRESAIKIF